MSGVVVYLFHVLRWRTNREQFQLAAMACGFVPFPIIIRRLDGVEIFQYLSVFTLSYAAAVITFRRQVFRKLGHDR